MRIIINNFTINIFSGAKLIDALRMYISQRNENFSIDDVFVEDKYGNKIEIDGSLKNNKSYFIKFKK